MTFLPPSTASREITDSEQADPSQRSNAVGSRWVVRLTLLLSASN